MNGETTHILGFDFVVVPFAETRSVQLPCAYLMAHRDPVDTRVHCILYAGQTLNLAQRFAGHHQLAKALTLGATHALASWVEDSDERFWLETLLRYHFRPPLNLEEIPSHLDGWRSALACRQFALAERAKAAHFKGERWMDDPVTAPWPKSNRA